MGPLICTPLLSLPIQDLPCSEKDQIYGKPCMCTQVLSTKLYEASDLGANTYSPSTLGRKFKVGGYEDPEMGLGSCTGSLSIQNLV